MDYRIGVDGVMRHEGKAVAYLLSKPGKTEGFGTLMQSIRATNYAGKRVRLRASMEARDVGAWAGLWMRVDRDQTVVAFDNMQQRSIKGTQAWGSHDVVLDVPEDATEISFGVLLTGSGEVRTTAMTFEVVGRETPVTGAAMEERRTLSATPVNLEFQP